MIAPPPKRRPAAPTAGHRTEHCSTAAPSFDEDTFGDLIGQLSQIGGRHGQRFERELARHLLKQIAGHAWDGKSEALARAHAAILAHNQHTKITMRRVRGLWHREAASIGFAEMCELAAVAGASAEGGE